MFAIVTCKFLFCYRAQHGTPAWTPTVDISSTCSDCIYYYYYCYFIIIIVVIVIVIAIVIAIIIHISQCYYCTATDARTEFVLHSEESAAPMEEYVYLIYKETKGCECDYI